MRASLQESIQDGLRRVSIMKKLAESCQRFVGRDDHGPSLEVAIVDHPIQHVGSVRGVALVALLGGPPRRWLPSPRGLEPWRRPRPGMLSSSVRPGPRGVRPFSFSGWGSTGRDKHRLAAARVCRTRWVDEAQAAFGVLEDPDGGQQLVRLTPNPTNPVAEWDISPVETAEPLRNPLVAPARPVVGPAGLLLFSAEDTVGNRDVYALETATGGLRRLTTSEGDDRQPSIDPEGRTVVFMSYRTGAGDLYRMNVDGSGLTRLTNHPLQDSRPWVRGDTVLFVRGRGEGDEDGNMELMLLDLRTGSETRLTENDWNDYDPRWSPDGTHICWLSEKDGHYESEVEVMELATGKRWNLSDSPGRDTLCRWTPDGRGIVYMAWRDGSESELFLKPFRGGRPMNLTRYPGEENMVDIMRLPDHFR